MSDVQVPPMPAPPVGGGAKSSFGERVIGALKLDSAVYDEIEHDPDALGQAAGVIGIAAVCSGIGSAAGGGGAIVAGVVASFLGWLVATGIVWLIGVRAMGHSSDYPELLRTLGFASAPQMLMILGVVPLLGGLVALVVFVWGLAAYVVAVRQALDVETGRAVLVCVLAWGASVLLGLVLATTCAGAGAGLPG